MLNDSYIGRLAQKILNEMDPQIQWQIETMTPEERNTFQCRFASYGASVSDEPYEYIYRAFGLVIEEIAELTEESIQ